MYILSDWYSVLKQYTKTESKTESKTVPKTTHKNSAETHKNSAKTHKNSAFRRQNGERTKNPHSYKGMTLHSHKGRE